MSNLSQPDLLGAPMANTESQRELIFTLTMPSRLPSWNEILGMEHWQRYKFKRDLANAFLYELRRTANDSLTKTTSARNTMLTYADTLASYLMTAQQQRKLKSASKRQNRGAAKKPESKCSESKVPF